MLTKKERDALRTEFETARNRTTSDGSSFYPTLHRAQLRSGLDLLDALDQMEAERDEARQASRLLKVVSCGLCGRPPSSNSRCRECAGV